MWHAFPLRALPARVAICIEAVDEMSPHRGMVVGAFASRVVRPNIYHPFSSPVGRS